MNDRFDFLELDNSRPRRVAHPARAEEVPSRQPPVVRALPHDWRIVEIIGGPGSGAGQFASPAGLAVDVAGNLFVADSYHHRVQRITPAGDVQILGRRGTGPGEFLNPQAIVTDDRLSFCVLEQGGCRIQRFGPNGEWEGAFGFRGSGPGEMLAPTAMARGPCGSLYVADTGNNRIVKWSAEGVFVDSFSHPLDGPLLRPQGIAVDQAGRVWLAETPRHRVLVLDALLRPLGALGTAGNERQGGVEPGQFREPQGLAVTPDGTLMVADTGNNRLQVLDQEGRPLQVIAGMGKAPAADAGRLNAPSALALPERGDPPQPLLRTPENDDVRPDLSAYLSDTGNNRVLRLRREDH